MAETKGSGGGWMAAAVGGAANLIGNLGSGYWQYNRQRRLNQQQYAHDIDMWNRQNAYNTPLAQMKRYEEAGLNKNLIYGQGSSGNATSMPQYPRQEAPRMDLGSLGSQILQMKYMQSQTDLTNQKVVESGIKQDLMQAQKALVEANPYLNKAYVESFVSNMQAIATMKKQEASVQPINQSKAIEKIQAEIALLDQKFNLNQVDSKIKAQILQSKEFQNYLNELTRKWIEDGGIDADSIRYGSLLLLNKFK